MTQPVTVGVAQGIDGEIQVPPDGAGKMVRNLVFSIAQQDGTMQQVYVEAVAVIDPITGLAVKVMTYDQADEMISLLRRLVELQEKR